MNRCRTARALFLLIPFLIAFQSGVALAQETQQTAQAEPVQRRWVAWTNPILFVFGWYMAEAEIRLQENHTVGVSGSYLQFDTGSKGDPDYEDTEYFSMNVFYRYYPTASFKGFFIGGQLGTTSVTYKDNDEDSSGSAFTAGVLIGYGWLLGDAQKIGVSLGIGANRLFGGDVDEDANTTIPLVRLINVGIAF
jgi:Protein of unknown function (DUF3575)